MSSFTKSAPRISDFLENLSSLVEQGKIPESDLVLVQRILCILTWHTETLITKLKLDKMLGKLSAANPPDADAIAREANELFTVIFFPELETDPAHFKRLLHECRTFFTSDLADALA